MELSERVARSAEAALADHQYVSLIDVLSGMSLLQNVGTWHNGRVKYVDELMQGSPEKIRKVIELFQGWAAGRGLRREDLPPHASFLHTPPKYHLASEYPALERAFRAHYVSPGMPEKKLEHLVKKVNAVAPPTVFMIVKDSKCSQCGCELSRGEMLTMLENRPLCLECGDLDHLVYIASGNAALTRRSTKYSSLWAVVVRFSKARGRYERQGVMVQAEALEKAEQECLEDADMRAARAVRDAERRGLEDVELAARMAERIQALYPGCPPDEAREIARHTALRGSGRVGRSAEGRALDDRALELAVGAWIRHQHTRYDELLMEGMERTPAREKIREEMDRVLERWAMAEATGAV